MGNTDDDYKFMSAVQSRLSNTRGSLQHGVDDINNRVTQGLEGAVNIVGSRAESVGGFINGLSEETFKVLNIVLEVASEYITENDLEIEVSNHSIQIKGDEDGLQKIRTDLKNTEISKGKDLKLEYDRDSGIDIQFKESNGD